jgi:hypothetical protein
MMVWTPENGNNNGNQRISVGPDCGGLQWLSLFYFNACSA